MSRRGVQSAVLTGATLLLSATLICPSGASGSPRPREVDHRPQLAISVTPSGGAGIHAMDLSFRNLLPGVSQRVTLNYFNSGTSREDLWIVFPNVTALSALNALGQYGAVILTSSGQGSSGSVFTSMNLDDNSTHCGNFTTHGCWPLQNQYRIASGVSPKSLGSFTFSFEFASAYNKQAPVGTTAYWNPYPTRGQTTIQPSDGSGAGLPYDLVAVEPGVTPGQRAIIHQIAPFNNEVDQSGSRSSFSSQLRVEESQEPATFVVTSFNPHISVSSSGRVSTVGGPLALGTYSVAGTDSNLRGSVGTWTYTLKVDRNHDEATSHTYD